MQNANLYISLCFIILMMNLVQGCTPSTKSQNHGTVFCKLLSNYIFPIRNKAEHAVQSYAAGVNYLSMKVFENIGAYCPHSRYMPSIFHEHAENIL